ncbi:hypothetical protein FIBSPDRAFT_1045969 [Athelia psychrophila]|uniref:Protein kinase domain-containing protein n=1 Tax=Athelia psychrophila TaxID=1759441 RepID=A0A166HAT4_9AGAM|nr:hypothetical protein FIBSPDRAFT_1045969 [Fibularhizoctonia sp. CBS 109695]
MDGALQDFAPVLTQACDVYSFGSIMLQTLSGKIPYHEVKSGAGVLVAIAQGIHPRRPNDGIMTDNYWKLKQLCWGKASERPSAEEGHRDVTGFHGAMAGSECPAAKSEVNPSALLGGRMLNTQRTRFPSSAEGHLPPVCGPAGEVGEHGASAASEDRGEAPIEPADNHAYA